MAGMKITPNSAMRARDVSRPRAEHLAAAAEREEAVTRRARKADRAQDAAPPTPADVPGAPSGAQ